MKKFLCLILVVMTVVMSFVGCSKTSDTDVGATEHTIETTTEAAEEITEEEKIPASVEWRDCKITIGGKEITLPCSYSEFTETGYKIPDKNMSGTVRPYDGTIFGGNTYILAEKTGFMDVGLTLVNTSDKELNYADCTVAGVKSYNDNSGDEIDVAFPGSMAIGKQYAEIDDIYAVYGTPDVEARRNGYIYCFWGKSDAMTTDDITMDGLVRDTTKKSYLRVVYKPTIAGPFEITEVQLNVMGEML